MADAGGAIGAASLALQVVQGLKAYYTQFRSYHDDVEAIVTRTTRLSMLLRVLERPIQKLDLDDDPISEECWGCIAECLRAVKKLETFQEKISATKQTAHPLKQKIQEIQNRAAYPFRKDTLQDMQKVLDRLLVNLQVVLQALQLDASLQLDVRSKERHERTQAQVHHVQCHQNSQSALLLSMDSRANAHFEASSGSAMRIENLVEALVQQLAQSQPRLIMQSSFDSHSQPDSSQLALRNSTDIRRPVRSEKRSLKNSVFKGLECHCPKSSQATQNTTRKRITLIWSTTRDHQRTCPLYVPTQYSSTVGTRIYLSRRNMGYLVEAALSWGGVFLSPQLSSRNVVPWESPAFRIIGILRSVIFRCTNVEKLPNALSLILNCLSRLFQTNRARPSDMLPDGSTLLHKVFDAVRLSQAFLETDNLNNFLRTLYEWRVPKNERSDDGYTPLEICLDRSNLNNDFDVPALYELEYGYSASHSYQYRNIYQNYRHLLLREDSHLVFTADPLSLSIFRQSEEDLIRALQTHSNPLSLHLSCFWPQGLRVQLLNGVPTGNLDIFGESALDWALRGHQNGGFDNFSAIEVLLESEVPTTRWTWVLVVEKGDRTLIKAIAQKMQRERDSSVPSQFWASECNATSKEGVKATRCPTLYHEWRMTSEAAEELFKVGSHGIDVNANCSHMDHEVLLGTPLWQTAVRLPLYHHDFLKSSEWWEFAQWLLDHGAKLGTCHPRTRTMPVHHFAQIIIHQARVCLDEDIESTDASWPWPMLSPLTEIPEFCNQIFRGKQKDECVCACSEQGCGVVTVAFSAILLRRSDADEHLVEFVIGTLLQIDPGLLESRENRLPILRVLTFDRLGLTHTCHVRHYYDIDGGLGSPCMELCTEEELEEVQDMEQDELELLEELMEEFDCTLQDHHGTFQEFIVGAWRHRMDEVIAKRNTPCPDELENIRTLGVVLHPMGPEEPPSSIWEPDPDHGSWEWFQRHLGYIMKENDC